MRAARMSGIDVLLAAADKQALDEQREMTACVARITTLEERLADSEKKLDGLMEKKPAEKKPVLKKKRRRGTRLAETAGVGKRLRTEPLRQCQACKVVKRSTKECGPVAGGRCGSCARMGKRCKPSYDRRRKDVVGGRWYVVPS